MFLYNNECEKFACRDWFEYSDLTWKKENYKSFLFLYSAADFKKKKTERERETEMWAPACWIPIMMMSANCTQPQLVWDTEMRCWCVKSHCCPGNNFGFNAFITKNLTVCWGMAAVTFSLSQINSWGRISRWNRGLGCASHSFLDIFPQ